MESLIKGLVKKKEISQADDLESLFETYAEYESKKYEIDIPLLRDITWEDLISKKEIDEDISQYIDVILNMYDIERVLRIPPNITTEIANFYLDVKNLRDKLNLYTKLIDKYKTDVLGKAMNKISMAESELSKNIDVYRNNVKIIKRNLKDRKNLLKMTLKPMMKSLIKSSDIAKYKFITENESALRIAESLLPEETEELLLEKKSLAD
jgi:hypothetical protein